jgi:hypothetical protein
MRAAIARDDIDGLERLAGEAEGIDREIARLGMVHPEARPAAQMFQFGKDNLEEGDVGELVERTDGLYAELEATAATLAGLLRPSHERKADGDAALR